MPLINFELRTKERKIQNKGTKNENINVKEEYNI